MFSKQKSTIDNKVSAQKILSTGIVVGIFTAVIAYQLYDSLVAAAMFALLGFFLSSLSTYTLSKQISGN